MKILRRREGFATNSSSTHSIIIAGSVHGSTPNAAEFGWDYFLCESFEQKVSYMLTQFVHAYKQALQDKFSISFYNLDKANPYHRIALVAYDEIFSFFKERFALSDDLISDIQNGYVDHQSQFSIPQTKVGYTLFPDINFWADLTEALAKDETVHIYGGNDNDSRDDDPSRIHSKWSDLINVTYNQPGSTVIKKDGSLHTASLYTIFTPNTGRKVHISFDQSIDIKTYQVSQPELIDVKITDYCNIGCTFCYQNSTEQGQHAPISVVEDFLDFLKDSNVLELALGGGEPTSHPEFTKILRMIKAANIVPNFTTKSLKWYSDVDTLLAVSEYCGDYAHSVVSVKELERIVKIKKNINDQRLLDNDWNKINPITQSLTIQYILDLHTLDNFTSIVKKLREIESQYLFRRITITLLGYKEVGRGGKRPYTNSEFLKEFKKIVGDDSKIRLGIDTVIATQYEKELNEENISETLYYKEEGRFSMYVDLVTKTYSKSSFEPTKIYKVTQHSSETLSSIFARVKE
jgi:organic radical activating enzyme